MITKFYFLRLLCRWLCFPYTLLSLGLYFNCSVGQGAQMSIFLPVMVKKSFQLSRLTTESQTLNSFTSEYLGESEGSWGKAVVPDPGESRLQATWVLSKPQRPWPWASQGSPQAQAGLGTLTSSPTLPGLAAGSCGSPSGWAHQLRGFVFCTLWKVAWGWTEMLQAFVLFYSKGNLELVDVRERVQRGDLLQGSILQIG